MILLKNCPVCHGSKIVKKIKCCDHTASKENFTIVSCETCNFLFTNPRPENSDLEDYYKSEMYISHTNKKEGLFNWMYQTARKYTIKKKVALIKQHTNKRNHLDFGCGTGEFLNACQKNGFKVKGVEPSEKARKQAIKYYNISVTQNYSLEGFKQKEFKSISLWHVLEHVPELTKTIKQLKRVLSNDGVLIIAVPNHKSWDCKYYKKFWAAWDVPIHLWHFSKENIELLFKKNGLKLVKTIPMLLDSFYVSLLSEKFKTGKKNFVKGLLIGIISNIIGTITKSGHSSVIYVFKKSDKN